MLGWLGSQGNEKGVKPLCFGIGVYLFLHTRYAWMAGKPGTAKGNKASLLWNWCFLFFV